MKILITGGAGFLGLHLAKFFSQKRNDLTLLDIAGFNSSEYPAKSRLVKADVRDTETVMKLCRNQDVIIHAAAALPLWRAKDIFAINIGGTRNLLEAAVKNKVKKFVFISSTAVYGVPIKHPIKEEDPLEGVGPYGESKIKAEKLCDRYRNKNLAVTVIRPKTFVGTYRLGVFEILFDWIKDGKRIPLIGSGDNHYQLLDVDDLVEAIYRIITTRDSRKVNTVFNLGAEKFRTVREDLEELFEFAYQKNIDKNINLTRPKKSVIFPTPAFIVKKVLRLFEILKLSPLYKWVYDTADKDSYVSIRRITKSLGWHPKYSNSEALIKAYRWYLENYMKIKSIPAGVTHRAGWKQGILGWFKKIL